MSAQSNLHLIYYWTIISTSFRSKCVEINYCLPKGEIGTGKKTKENDKCGNASDSQKMVRNVIADVGVAQLLYFIQGKN